MRWGVSGRQINAGLPYAMHVVAQCAKLDFPETLAYAIAWRESIHGEVTKQWPLAAKVVSEDGGHGLFQLTSWFPDPGWDNPSTNAYYAIKDWLLEDCSYFNRQYNIGGEFLVAAVASSFNAGRGVVIPTLDQGGHDSPDVLALALDPHTSNNYASNVLKIYRALTATGKPPAD